MEKYGVDTKGPKEKTAGKVYTCPKCGLVLISTNPRVCPKCGSEPFEVPAQPEEEDGDTTV